MTTTDALKAAMWTMLWTFVGLFSMSLVGWVSDLVDWASSSGSSPMPSLSALGYAAVAAAASSVAGLLNFAFRLAQSKGVIPGSGPTYGSGG